MTVEALAVDLVDRHVTALTPGPVTPASAPVRAALAFESVAHMLARVDAAGPPRWLLRGIWPSDAYGVLAAEDKAGKSWAACDAAVAVASGTAWLGAYECDDPGPVLLLAGEGGARNLSRRLRAVASARGLDAAQLSMRVCERVPHLTDPAHLGLLAEELSAHPARLVILDPLYLAARGSSGSDLYAMGEALEGLQHVSQRAGAALLVVTHFNKTGEGRGAKRITGVGPGAWGRVLITAHVEHRDTDPSTRRSTVILGIEMVGGEIADGSLRLRRQVWSDRPDDLGAPLHYVTEVIPDEPPMAAGPGDDLSPAARRVLAVLSDVPQDRQQIGDRLADSGRPLTKRTIQDAASRLVSLGLAFQIEGGPRGAYVWVRSHN